MKTLLSILLIVCCTSTVVAQKKKRDPFQYIKQDTSTAITSQQLAVLARTFKDKAYKLVYGKEKQDLDKELRRLDVSDTIKLRATAYELSSEAMVLMGSSQSENATIILAAAPVAILPGDPILVNNFCSLLRMMDSISLSLPALVYAKNLAPKHPVILTNLGNSLLELGDDRKAEVFFKRALGIDPHFRDARSSLVSVYLKRHDLSSAYDELMKGVEEVTYSEATKLAFDRTTNDGARKQQTQSSTQTPPPPAGPASSGEDGAGAGNAPDKLVLPPFPDWTDLKAFMHAKGPAQWDKDNSKGFSDCSDDLMKNAQKQAAKYQQVLKLPFDQQRQAMQAIQNAPFTKAAHRNEYAMQVMQQYIDDRFYQIDKDYKETEEKNGAKFNKSFKACSDAFELRSAALARTMQSEVVSVTPQMELAANGRTDEAGAKKIGEAAGEALMQLPKYQELLIEYCRQTKRLQEDNFEDWKKNARTWHSKTNDLLQEYWTYCEQYLNGVYGDDYDRLSNERMLYVYGRLSVLSGAYSVMPLAFMAAFTNSSGDCAKATPVPESTPDEADMATTVPKKKGPPCPWENGGKLKVGAGPCSLALDCESIECECLAGVGGAAKWNFKNKTTTLTPEVGVKFELGLPGPEVGEMHYKIAEVNAKVGVAITFDKDGQPYSWNDENNGIKVFGEVGGSVNVGPASSGGSVQLNYQPGRHKDDGKDPLSACAGLNSEFAYEVAASR